MSFDGIFMFFLYFFEFQEKKTFYPVIVIEIIMKLIEIGMKFIRFH